MNTLENYYKKVIRYDLINKFYYNKIKKIPKLKKIILNFGYKKSEMKLIAPALFALEILSLRRGSLTTSKRANILLKIRKGSIVGCVVVLKKDEMYYFFLKLLIDVFPNLKDFKGFIFSKNLKNSSFSFTLKDLINFKDLERQFYLFTNLPSLNIVIITNSTTAKELNYLLNSYKLPLAIK